MVIIIVVVSCTFISKHSRFYQTIPSMKNQKIDRLCKDYLSKRIILAGESANFEFTNCNVQRLNNKRRKRDQSDCRPVVASRIIMINFLPMREWPSHDFYSPAKIAFRSYL